MNTTFAVVIPARLESERLPRKVLLKDTGKYLIQHVWEQLKPLEERACPLIIATDSEKVSRAASSFGAKTRMTGSHHLSGTERAAEVAHDLDVQVVVNVQGDEPSIEADDVVKLVSAFDNDPDLNMATLARVRKDAEAQRNSNIVKIVTDAQQFAIYFSRAQIPFPRRGGAPWLHHTGVYAYRREFLLKLPVLPRGRLEQIEKLEQLRVLETGYKIKVVLTEKEYEGIDTMEQYQEFVKQYKSEKGEEVP